MATEQPISNVSGEREERGSRHRAQTPIDHVLERLSRMVLPAKEHFESYLRHKWRVNHKPRTISSSFTSIMLFLQFYGASGKSDIAQLGRPDLEAFIEHEQDRGINISTVRTKMASIIAFLHFLIGEDLIPATALKRTIKLKLPDALPRAMNPKDVRKLLAAIDSTRDRALILLLLRTGVRIGEALGLTVNDIDLKERKVHLFEGEKNSMGRVVYLSSDALFAVKRWFSHRDTTREYIFYGQGKGPLCYSAARIRFVHYLTKAHLEHKGYTVHCLRHYSESLIIPSRPQMSANPWVCNIRYSA